MDFTVKNFIFGLIILVSILIIIVVLLQPTKNTGLIGETGEQDKIEKRSFEKFLYNLTIFLGISLFALCISVGFLE